MIFVYGSNAQGSFVSTSQRHALRTYGAMYGATNGQTGQAYAIQIRGLEGNKLNLTEIKRHVDRFLAIADRNPETIYKVASFPGFAVEEIAPMFFYAPKNVVLPLRYKAHVKYDGIKRKYWMA